MNKIKYVKNARMSQVIIKSQRGQVLDERGLYAFTDNRIQGLLKAGIEKKNTSFKLVYTTTGFITLKDYLKNTMNREDFFKLLQNILNILQSVQNANFFTEDFLYDINYVFVNPSTKSPFFIYVPISNFESGTLRDFLLSLVQHISFLPGEDSGFIREYVSILNKNPAFSHVDLKNYINSIVPGRFPENAAISNARCPRCGSLLADNIKFCAACGNNVSDLTGQSGRQQNSNVVIQEIKPRHGYSQPIDLMGIPARPPQLKQSEPPKSSCAPSSQRNAPQYPQQSNYAPNDRPNVPQYTPQSNYAPNDRPNVPQYTPQSNYAPNGQPNTPQYPPQNNFFPNEQFNAPIAGGIPDDMYFGGTVVLNEGSSQPAAAYLIRLSTGEKTAIDKPQFTVGRMLGHVDYCVMNNSAVGRQHIKITNNNGRYFICDLNSTNGTYIDEHEIPKNVDTEVFPGAKVTLANEDFKFVIE